MSSVTCTSVIPRERLANFLAARNDEILEVQVAPGVFELAEGPFRQWRREVTSVPVGDDEVEVTQRVDFVIAAPLWRWLFVLPLRGLLKRRHHQLGNSDGPVSFDTMPVWLPPDRLDMRAATVLATVCSLSVVVGYLGTVLTQTITYAADQFGATTANQGQVLASVRIGVLGSLVVVAMADRKGRRLLLLGSIAASCVTAAASALSTSMVMLGVTQSISRAFSTSAAILLGIVAAEEMPRSSRAYAVGVMTLAGGLGAGVCVWFLPLAGASPSGWRVLYVIPLIGLVPLLRLAKVLPETRRFTQRNEKVPLTGHGKRLAIVGAALFGAALFAAPASQLQNTFLDHERGFTASRIALFTLLTTTPAGIAVAIGGRLADTHGRRIVGGIGVLGGSVLVLIGYFSHGWSMWVWTLAGTMFGGASVPAMGVYGPELFPTALRGKAYGILQVIAVAGSSVGLLTVSSLVDRWGGMGPAMTLMLSGPILVALLLAFAYPETAHRTLEEVNPEDLVASDPVRNASLDPDGR